MQINFSNLSKISQTSPSNGLEVQKIQNNRTKFDILWQEILDRNQGFLDLPKNQQQVIDIKAFIQDLPIKYEHIVLLGIGGSSLGPQTIVDALGKNSQPKIYFMDNIDPDFVFETLTSLDLAKTLVLVQTKSGTTPETLAQYFLFKEQLIDAELELKNHFVFVTDPEKSYLLEEAKSHKIFTFIIPPNVGGRFSVLSPVGLLVAQLAGISADNILEGAQHFLERTQNLENYLAFDLATTIFELEKTGKKNLVIMPYSSKLKTFSAWCVQLIAESLGKEIDLQNNLVNRGITPIGAVGATDQHSSLQLFKEGPDDKLLVFIEIEEFSNKIQIPSVWENTSFDYFANHTFNDLISSELKATSTSLTESNKPNLTITIPKLDGFNLGKLFMLFELAVAFLGQMWQVDTYNQPGVERSKVLTREFLAKK